MPRSGGRVPRRGVEFDVQHARCVLCLNFIRTVCSNGTIENYSKNLRIFGERLNVSAYDVRRERALGKFAFNETCSSRFISRMHSRFIFPQRERFPIVEIDLFANMLTSAKWSRAKSHTCVLALSLEASVTFTEHSNGIDRAHHFTASPSFPNEICVFSQKSSHADIPTALHDLIIAENAVC